MVVTCESCSARFRLDDAKVPETGAKVRCSKCQHTFVVFPQGADEITFVSDDDFTTLEPESLALDDDIATAVVATPTLSASTSTSAALGLSSSVAPTRKVSRDEAAAVLQRSSVHEAQTKVHKIAPLQTALRESSQASAEAPKNGSASPSSDPFSAGLDENLFADLPAPEPDHAGEQPFDPFAGAAPTTADDKSSTSEARDPAATRPSALQRIITMSSVAVALLLLLGGLAYFVAADMLLRLVGAKPANPPLPSSNGLSVSSAISVLYPTAAGEMLVVTGEVVNKSQRRVTNMWVVGELPGPDAKSRAVGRGPVGAAWSPEEVAAVTDAAALVALEARKGGQAKPIEPGESLPFGVAFLRAPNDTNGPPSPALRLEADAGPRAPDVAAAPASDAASGDELAAEDDKKKKAKGKKAKTKAKRKGKIK